MTDAWPKMQPMATAPEGVAILVNGPRGFVQATKRGALIVTAYAFWGDDVSGNDQVPADECNGWWPLPQERAMKQASESRDAGHPDAN